MIDTFKTVPVCAYTFGMTELIHRHEAFSPGTVHSPSYRAADLSVEDLHIDYAVVVVCSVPDNCKVSQGENAIAPEIA